MTRSKTAVLAELISRQGTTDSRVIELEHDFPEQDAFIEDKSRYIAAQCSRRAGKSNGLAIRFYQTMQKYPKSQCLYVSLTQESARGIMWGILQEINDKYKIGCIFTESKLEVKHPNGAKLKLMGADLKDFIKRLKGRKYPGVGIDEAQDFGSHLESLVDDVLTPSISDYEDGWLAITGTPGPVPNGYFFEITQERKRGYSFHSWTSLENPHMPDPKAFLDDLLKQRQWPDDHPSFLREYRNQWVLDVESLWIRYKADLNGYNDLPKDHKWNYIMGVDVGFKDADAIAIIAWSETCPITYLVEERIEAKQGLTELVDQMNAFHKKYEISKVVMDEGGLGKKLAEEVRRRHGINVEPADKARKQENVDFLNDAMRLGKFKAKPFSRFVQDSYKVQIDWDKTTPNRIVIKKKPHSDIIDAVLYAFKESYAFTHTPEKVKPKWGTKEWADAEEDTMFEKELDGHIQADSFNKWLKGE